MAWVLWLAVALPAGAALAARASGRAAGVVAPVGALAAAVPAWALLVGAADGERLRSTVTWLPAAGLDAGLRLDALSAAMAAIVATAGLVVVLYASGYFAAEPRAPAALAGLLGFLAAMQGLVLADGYLTLLVFWELVGAASARLIAFDRGPAAATGAVRAFLVTRGADVGLYLALLALLAGAGTLDFGAQRPDGALGALVGLGLVAAAMGKSAQAPLQTWLAGAMAGPTPVSALLHSATMVAAGVYLLVRSDALLAGWPLALAGWVGAVTAVAGAVIALAQDDLKRVLAGSTSSQLGLMFVGAAAGGPAVALFHLAAHAAGKAGLFLATGIFGRRRGSTALADLRGAGRADRPAFAAFAVCALSIAAVPPLAAFWSKEAIVVAAEERAAWFALVLVAGGLSAAYLLRPARVLWGARDAGAPATGGTASGRPAMLAGAGLLALASLAAGALGAPLADLLGAAAPRASLATAALTLLAAAAGAALLLVARPPAALRRAAARQLHTEVALRAVFRAPALAAAHTLARFDDRRLDAAVDGTGRGGLAAARAQRWVEERGVDSAVDGLARLVGRGGRGLRHLQTGRLYEYLRDTVVGAAAVAAIVVATALT